MLSSEHNSSGSDSQTGALLTLNQNICYQNNSQFFTDLKNKAYYGTYFRSMGLKLTMRVANLGPSEKSIVTQAMVSGSEEINMPFPVI